MALGLAPLGLGLIATKPYYSKSKFFQRGPCGAALGLPHSWIVVVAVWVVCAIGLVGMEAKLAKFGLGWCRGHGCIGGVGGSRAHLWGRLLPEGQAFGLAARTALVGNDQRGMGVAPPVPLCLLPCPFSPPRLPLAGYGSAGWPVGALGGCGGGHLGSVLRCKPPPAPVGQHFGCCSTGHTPR